MAAQNEARGAATPHRADDHVTPTTIPPRVAPADLDPQEPCLVTGLEKARPCSKEELLAWVDRWELEGFRRDAIEQIVERCHSWMRWRIRHLVREELAHILTSPGTARALLDRLAEVAA